MTTTPPSPTFGDQPSPAAPPPKPSIWAGSWYFLVTVVSVGLLAWIPFAHAASRLHTRSSRVLTAVYVAAAVAVLVLLSVTPEDTSDLTAADDALAIVTGLLIPCVVVSALVGQAFLRRQVYAPKPADPRNAALTAALAARARRAEARRLVATDPLLARDLHIGRPDLPRTYDDGGLVDLNSAPAAVLAQACGLSPDVANEIVSIRTARGGYLTVDDVFSMADIPVTYWDIVRDRALVVPSHP